MSEEYKFTWRGKEIPELSKEQLLKACEFLVSNHVDSVHYSTNAEIEDLKKELAIKNDLIDRLVKR